MAEEQALDARALLDAWRDSGADRLDPVRFGTMQALARRAEGYDGAARRVLDDRLAALADAYRATVARAAGTQAAADAQASPPGSAGLADLVARMQGKPDGGEPEGLARLTDYFRDTWIQVRARRELRHSVERVPENAGPLNSSHLVQRALSLMGEVSPGYLQQFLTYVDALSSLERLQGTTSAPGKEPSQGSGAKKAARTRRPKDGARAGT